ncbi:MAG: hypothetical protein PHP53_06735 [Prolixibacteraceae bacterium]|nr:hypothetical protein [Prolixibacteraceae bacterium]
MRKMKKTNILLLLILIGSVSIALGQEKQISMSNNDNAVRSKIAAVNNFKLPYSVEIFSGNERDQKNRTVVNGLTVKGVIVSSAVSSVGNLAGGAGGGASSASYAATGRMSNSKVKITISQPETGDEASTITDENGNFSVTLKHDTLHTIYVNGVEYGQVKLKTKHDTAKNSVSNIR